MMQDLWDVIYDDEEYHEVASIVRHMLHPSASARATVSEVLTSAMFADC